MNIKYICSLGNLCHTASFLKSNNLKLASYPFDWIFSNLNNIIHCIETNFILFLDKTLYIKKSENKCNHIYYDIKSNDSMFNHHNPLNNDNKDYNYFVRCVDRFNKLLNIKEYKLFIIIFTNLSKIDNNLKESIIDFNNKFKKYTNNYTLLCIFNYMNKKEQKFTFTNFENIDFLEMDTLSTSNGVKFINEYDNVFIADIIKNKYIFDLEKIH